MIKLADVLFLPLVLVVATATQLAVLHGLGLLSPRFSDAPYMMEAVVASVVLLFTCWWDFLRCRTGHAVRFLIALAVAASATWATLIPAVAIVCLIVRECF